MCYMKALVSSHVRGLFRSRFASFFKYPYFLHKQMIPEKNMCFDNDTKSCFRKCSLTQLFDLCLLLLKANFTPFPTFPNLPVFPSRFCKVFEMLFLLDTFMGCGHSTLYNCLLHHLQSTFLILHLGLHLHLLNLVEGIRFMNNVVYSCLL